jgi:hypothetical protein
VPRALCDQHFIFARNGKIGRAAVKASRSSPRHFTAFHPIFLPLWSVIFLSFLLLLGFLLGSWLMG